MINIITAKEATALSNEELSVKQIRMRIFDGIYNKAQEGGFVYEYLSRNEIPGGICLELVSLGYQVVKSKYADDDSNYHYNIYWGTDVVAQFYEK